MTGTWLNPQYGILKYQTTELIGVTKSARKRRRGRLFEEIECFE